MSGPNRMRTVLKRQCLSVDITFNNRINDKMYYLRLAISEEEDKHRDHVHVHSFSLSKFMDEKHKFW